MTTGPESAPQVHGVAPLTVETPRAALRGPVTPTRDLYVRQNLDLPSPGAVAAGDAWQVRVSGVARPAVVTLAELRGRAALRRRMVLECAGNGREAAGARFDGETAWGVGATACVEWTGARVGDLVAELGGPQAGARFLTALGGDAAGRAPDPVARRVERSVPLAKGLADGLLAWALNGGPIPLVHGGPVRLVVPGYYAVNSVKFLQVLALTATESDSDIQRVRYRLRPPGVPAAPSQPSAWTLRVKSLLTSPADGTTVPAGPVEVSGVAWSGHGPVRRVEVSADDGRSWTAAALPTPAADPAEWREFSATVTLPAGRRRVVSRATDAAGDVQPEVAAPTESGYAHNGWRHLGLELHAC